MALDDETQAAVDRAAAESPPEGEAPEVNLEPGTEGEPEGSEVEQQQAPEQRPTPEPAGLRDPLEDRLARMERENADLRERVQRFTQPPQAEPDDTPPVTAINSFDDLNKLMEWRETNSRAGYSPRIGTRSPTSPPSRPRGRSSPRARWARATATTRSSAST